MTVSRRRFLGLAGGAVAVTAGGVGAWEGLLRDHVDTRSSTPSPTSTDRVLVVVQLTGGNDGLNTLVPVDGRYHDARPTLGIADGDLVPLAGEDGFGLAPELATLAGLWEAGRLAALDGVGFEGSSHSHFEALDWWWSGQPGRATTTGWLGRWLDATAGDGHNPLRGIALGAAAPHLRAEHALATVINDPTLFDLRAPDGVDGPGLVKAFTSTGSPIPFGGRSLDSLARASMVEVAAAVERLAPAGVGTTGGEKQAVTAVGGGRRSISGDLDLAARLIGLDLGTRVIALGAGGFDTHAGEASSHKALLTDLGEGLASFFATIDHAGHGDRVLVVTTSEFGRRVQENGSGGTDHGSGSVHFVAGSGLRVAAVRGHADLAHPTAGGDVQPAIDARSLYAVGLDWLGGPTADVLGRQYDTYGLLRA